MMAHKSRKAPDEQSTQAKALPVRFDTASAKPDLKQDVQTGGTPGQPKDERTAGTPADSQVRVSAAIPQQRADIPAQGDDHHTSAAAAQTPPQQVAGRNDNSSGASTAASPSAMTMAASGSAASQATQGGAPTLQVVPQQAPAAAPVPPDPAALAITIAAKSKDGEKHFDIRLDPPELGRVDVRLSVDSSGKAQAHLTADNLQTLHLLQRDRHDLARSLKDAGLNLSNNGLNFSLKGQDRQGDSAPAPKGGSALGLKAVASGEAPTPATKIHGLTASRSRLDIRV